MKENDTVKTERDWKKTERLTVKDGVARCQSVALPCYLHPHSACDLSCQEVSNARALPEFCPFTTTHGREKK